MPRTQETRHNAATMPRRLMVLILLLCVALAAGEGTCHAGGGGDDVDDTCEGVVRAAEPTVQPSDMSSWWGEAQDLQDPLAQRRFPLVEEYMKTVIMVDPLYAKVRDQCKFKDASCVYWSAIGECEANPKYMQFHCAPACQSCEMLDWETRCQFDRDLALWKDPGKVNATMERIVREYNRTVQIWSDDPWILTLDDFVSPTDCETLIDWGHKRQFERSVDAGKVLADGSMASVVSQHRTSTNAWCLDGCYQDPVTQAVLERLEKMLDIPRENYEYFQLLKYEAGEFYKRHHDYNIQELDRPQGNRIMTVYIYLNDVLAGGGTRFNSLGLEITPKRGRVLIWPSVKDDNPLQIDGRMDHEALPVEQGVKFGANIFIHQRDFVDAFARQCM